MNEMKPCPICKREHEIDIDAEFGGVMFRHKNFDWNKDQCLLAEQELSENVSVDRFVEIWNSRPIEDQLKSENERLQIEKVYFEELANKWSKQYYKDCDQLKSENKRLREALKIIVKVAGKFEWWSELGIKTNNGESVIDTMEQTAQQALREVKE